jgi:hypothetical protein
MRGEMPQNAFTCEVKGFGLEKTAIFSCTGKRNHLIHNEK